jgi:hypothetical protein
MFKQHGSDYIVTIHKKMNDSRFVTAKTTFSTKTMKVTGSRNTTVHFES